MTLQINHGIFSLQTLSDNPDFRVLYVLLDGATTPNIDSLARKGKMGQVISVGKGISPQSDIAVFNMLGYNFEGKKYAGRGIVEIVGSDIDFRDGDLALRGNFATLDDNK